MLQEGVSNILLISETHVGLFGRRSQKSSSSGTTNCLYDGADLIEELDSSGNELARYALGSLDEPLAETRSGTTAFYEQDGLGSVTSLSSSMGALSNTYTYDAFGNLTASTGSLGNPFQYTGRDFDPETGLRFYRARYYDSGTGRFLSEDPIRFMAGNNFYRYVGNNPTRFRDPTGRSAGAIAIPVAEGVGTVICFGSGVCETVIVVGGIVVGVAATGYAIYHFFSGTKVKDHPEDEPGKKPKCDDPPGYEICRYAGEFQDAHVDPQFKICAYTCEAGPMTTQINPIGAPCPPYTVRIHK